jgi:CDP-glucose 4,6-dehydratase
MVMTTPSLAPHYRGRRVLVTGHTGFKGTWLSAWLREMGAHVTGLALDPEDSPSLFDLAKLDLAADLRGDVRDPAAVERAFEAARPEIVFHMAAQPLVRRSYRDPVFTFSTNVMGTVNVLEACRRQSGLKAVVVVTTDKVYENQEWVWGYREGEPLGGRDPYSASKACAEIATAAYRKSFFGEKGSPAVASARAGNVIGGGDFCEDRIIPDIIRGIAAGRPAAIRNPAATRPWQHVLDALSGYLLLAKRLEEEPERFAEAWNFGPEQAASVPVSELAEKLVRRLGRGELSISPRDPSAPHEARALELDISKARAVLGWRPRLDIDAAIELVAELYGRYLDDPAHVPSALRGQIAAYERWGA